MDFAKVSAEFRTTTGKGNARATRRSGKVPAVIYGRKSDPVSLTVDPLAISKSLDKERRRNTVFSMQIAGAAAGKDNEVLAMISDVQYNPLSRRVVHIDFLRIALDEEVRVRVPLVLVGTAAGVIDGGQLHQPAHDVPIAAMPNGIPAKLELDVSALKIGDALHVSDLTLTAGVRILLPPKEALASVVAPRADKEEAPAAAEAAAAPGAEAAKDGDKKDGDKKDGAKKDAPAAAAKDGDKKGK